MDSSTGQGHAGTLPQWTDFFRACGIPPERGQSYAAKFFDECIRPNELPKLTKDDYRELEVKLQDRKDIERYLAATDGSPPEFGEQAKPSSTIDDDVAIVDVVKKEPQEPSATAAVQPSRPKGEHELRTIEPQQFKQYDNGACESLALGTSGFQPSALCRTGADRSLPTDAATPSPLIGSSALHVSAHAQDTQSGGEEGTPHDPTVKRLSMENNNACYGLEVEYKEMEVCDEFPDNETREVAPMEQSIPLNATTYSGGVECSPITIEKRRKNTPESFRTKRPSPTASTVINRKQMNGTDTKSDLRDSPRVVANQPNGGTKTPRKPGKTRLLGSSGRARRPHPPPRLEMHHEDEFPPPDQRNAIQQMTIDRLQRNGQLIQHANEATLQERILTLQESLPPRSDPHSLCKRSGSRPSTWQNTRAVLERPSAKRSCDYCNYSTSNKTHLKEHQRTHTGAKLFHCDVCGNRFARLCTLKEHRRIHTGEKPYRCDRCDYGSRDSSSLTTHKRRMHTGEKPYACHYKNCGYRAAKKGDLDVHLRKHTGVKPHKCPKCEYRSAEKGELNAHVRRKH